MFPEPTQTWTVESAVHAVQIPWSCSLVTPCLYSPLRTFIKMNYNTKVFSCWCCILVWISSCLILPLIMQVRSHICKQKIPSPCCVRLKKNVWLSEFIQQTHTVMFHALTGKRDAKFKVLTEYSRNLLLPLKYCSSRTKIFIFSQVFVLKNTIMTHDSNESNYTAD